MQPFRILLIFILLLNCYFTIDGKASTSFISKQSQAIEEIVHFARDYRKDTTLSSKQEILRQRNILENVFSSLTNYSAFATLEEAALSFIADVYPKKASELTVVNANQKGVGGKSKDIVFLVSDSNGYLCYVLKAFRNLRKLSGMFLQEISALDLIEELSLPGVVPIKPIACAKWCDQEQEWGMLLQTAATGKRVDQFIYHLREVKQDPESHAAHLTKCQMVFRKIAEVLAGLHWRKSLKADILPEHILSKYDQRLKKILENSFIATEIGKHVSIEDFVRYVLKIKHEAAVIPVFYSYWHGDAHLSNMFYDDQLHSFSFIDSASLHSSISQQSEPLCEGTMDVIRVEEALRYCSDECLTECELTDLLNTFYENYEHNSSQKISQPILLFYRTFLKLQRLLVNANFMTEDNPMASSCKRRVFEETLQYFENQIQIEKIKEDPEDKKMGFNREIAKGEEIGECQKFCVNLID